MHFKVFNSDFKENSLTTLTAACWLSLTNFQSYWPNFPFVIYLHEMNKVPDRISSEQCLMNVICYFSTKTPKLLKYKSAIFPKNILARSLFNKKICFLIHSRSNTLHHDFNYFSSFAEHWTPNWLDKHNLLKNMRCIRVRLVILGDCSTINEVTLSQILVFHTLTPVSQLPLDNCIVIFHSFKLNGMRSTREI